MARDPVDRLTATTDEECPVENNPRLVARFKAKSEIAAAGIHDQALVRELAEVGFDGDSIRALVFIPLLEVAWADGEIQAAERETFETLMARRGIEPDSRAYRLVTTWLGGKPCDALYTRGRALINQIMHEAREHAGDVEWILKAGHAIALASSNVYAELGLASSITPEEERAIRRLAQQLGYDGGD